MGMWDLRLLAEVVWDMDTKSWENAVLFRKTLCKSQAHLKKVTKSVLIMKTETRNVLP